MPKLNLRLHGAATLALLTVTTGCSFDSPSELFKNRGASHSTTRPVAAESPACPDFIDPFTKAIDKAQTAANLAQSAQSRQDWDLVVLQWIQAIEAMQSVPTESPRRAFAQKKAVEYLRNLDIAQQKASTITADLPFNSFGNPIFDEQLLLYLSYVATMGPPDILIVGSSRALVGLDPQRLQQALAAQGKPGLKVFNFAINGGTAQLVDFQLRQLLTRNQLPRMIVWADGVRAFNSGRVDRTYNSLVSSLGYQQVQAGDRPTLPPAEPDNTAACEDLPGTSISRTTKSSTASSSPTTERWRLSQVTFNTNSNPDAPPSNRLLLTQLDPTAPPQRLTLVRNTTGYSGFAIDANGFLPLDGRFNPQTYYKQNPRVAGRYDGDYQPFSLAGQQAVALNSVKAFAQQQNIPLVFVNLPLTQDYLDAVRLTRERQFVQSMQRQVGGGFVFIDMGRLWLNQNDYFTDPSHLNRYGAATVANWLANNPNIPWPEPR